LFYCQPLCFRWLSPLHAQSVADKTDKLVRLLKEDNYNYVTTSSPTVFVIHLTGTKPEGHQGPSWRSEAIRTAIWSSLSRDSKSDHASHGRFSPTPCLKPIHDYDQVKVGFDGDDDLSVRIDGSMRLADAAYLKVLVEPGQERLG